MSEDEYRAAAWRREDIERFAAAAAHDLKSPLISIRALAEMVEETLEDEHPARRHVDLIALYASHALSGITQLREFVVASSQTPRRTATDIVECVHRAMPALVDRIASSDAVVRCDAETAVFADPDLMTLVMRSLIANAIDHCGAARPDVTIRTRPTDSGVDITVADNGGGVPEAAREQMFEPFRRIARTAESARRHAGLGLSLCKSIVERHGGRIAIEGGPDSGAGCVVRVALPHDAQRDAGDPNPAAAAPDVEASDSPATVLLVDDEPADLRQMAACLRAANSNLNVVATADPAHVKELIDAHDPDLVCLDFCMPVQNGADVMTKIRNDAAHDALPVVVISSTADDGDVRRCMDARATAFYEKPTSADGYRNLARELIEKWLTDARA